MSWPTMTRNRWASSPDLLRLGHCKGVGCRGDLVPSAQAEELLPVASSIRGNAAQHTFLEQILLIAEPWKVTEPDTSDGEGATTVETGQGRRDQFAGGDEQHRPVHRALPPKPQIAGFPPGRTPETIRD